MSQGRALVKAERQNAELSRPIYFLATFWGKQFRDWFCFYAVQSLLSPKNIPGLGQREFTRFLICTTREDWEALQKETIIQQLRKQLDIVFIGNEALFPGEHKYHRMSRGHSLLANECFKYSALAININPDSIYPDGCVVEAERLAREGKNVILCTAIRFKMEGVRDALIKSGALNWGHPLTLPMRQAVELGLRNLHAESRAGNWRAPNFGRLAPEHKRTHLLTCCYWRVPNEPGCIIVTHNWAPFLVNYAALKDHNVKSLDGRAIDGDYVYENFGDDSESNGIHVVTDSDSIFLLGLTPRGEMVPPNEKRWWKSIPVIGQWSRGYIFNQTVFDASMDPLKRRQYQTQVRWHANATSSRWQSVEQYARKCIDTYATRNLARVFTGTNLPRYLWFRAIHTDIFRPFGAPTRMEILKRKLHDTARKTKPYIYARAVLLALRRDKIARGRILRRTKKITLLSSYIFIGSILVFTLLNFASYAFIEYATPGNFGPVRSNGAESPDVRGGISDIRYESGWSNAYVRSVLGEKHKPALVLGGANVVGSIVAADQTIAAQLNRISPAGSPVFLTVGSGKSTLRTDIEKLVQLLQSSIRPKLVIVFTSWKELIANRVDIKLGTFGKSPVESLLTSLPLVRLIQQISNKGIFGSISIPNSNDGTVQDEELANFTAMRTSNLERNRLGREVRESFRLDLEFLQKLADGFGFQILVFHQPIGLSYPKEANVSGVARSARTYEFIVTLNEQLRRQTTYGLGKILDGEDGARRGDAMQYAAAANQKIAQAIARVIGGKK